MSDLKWRTGRQPTRAEVVAEIGRELAKRRNQNPVGASTPQADERIDSLQSAYDNITEKWPR